MKAAALRGAARPAAAARVRRRRSRPVLLTLFLLVPLLYLLATIGLPVLYNLVMSVQDVSLGNLSGFDRPFVGLDNYREAVADPRFWKVIGNSAMFVGVNVVAQVGLGTVIAACFARGFPGADVLRGLFLAAWILPGLVVGTVWKWMLATQYGVVNFFLSFLGLVRQPVHWLSDPGMAMTSLNIVNIWFGTPFSMILVASALTGVPDELYEAAELDGAGRIARFRHISLPAIAPAVLAVACLVVIGSLRAFDVIFALTQGGPLDATNVLPLLSYQASFQDFAFGRGAATGTFAFLVVFAVALLYVRTVRHEAR